MMLMRNVLLIILSVSTLVNINNIPAFALQPGCYPGIICVADKIGPETIALTGATKWKFDTLEIANGTVIQTNGFPLDIEVARDLNIIGSATIRSFPEGAQPLARTDEPSAGASGVSWDRGPNTGGRCEGCDGRNGGDGQPGALGQPGAPGKDAGLIRLSINGNMGGKLIIMNNGMTGGDGSNGGNGGPGGNGEQGGRSVGKGGPFGVKLGCAQGPGKGGNGGKGGAAGNGGSAGAGGRGGDVFLFVKGDRSGTQVIIQNHGGGSGEPGNPGVPGPGGLPGFGGRGSSGCEGREIQRQGLPGQNGDNGVPGSRAPSGVDGTRG